MIFGILMTVLFRTYSIISDISIRVEAEKQIQSEILFVNQVMNNLADNYTIDYDAYAAGDINGNGVVETLQLIRKGTENDKVTIQTAGDQCF
jgi:hypothetical protein